MTETKRFSLVKPTLNTPFQIDFDWWKEHDNNWRVFLQGYLCLEHQAAFAAADAQTSIDWVDPDTAEIRVVDGLQNTLMTHCAQQDDFITSYTTMVDAVFRVLLAHGNEPMTPVHLGQIINRPPDTILRLFSGMQVYKGIRPRHI